jgi:hypothetical protein
MKRIGLPMIGFVLLLVACSNITLFNKVQVKSAPTIYMPVGGTKIEVKNFLTFSLFMVCFSLLFCY